MFELKKFEYECSLRTGTLVLLWIVMICCGFHLCYLNISQDRLDNEESNSSARNSTNNSVHNCNEKTLIQDDVLSLHQAGRRKRAIGFKEKIGSYIAGVGELPQNILKSTLDEIYTKYSSILWAKAENITDTIIRLAVKKINETGILNVVSKQIAKDVACNINKVVEERKIEFGNIFQTYFGKFIGTLIHSVVRSWNLLGISSSALGIYGIYNDIPKFLKFSVLFFQLSVASQFLILLVINTDIRAENVHFLVSEMTGINIRAWMIFIYAGILISIALSTYSVIVVKKYREAMLKKESIPKTGSNDEICEHEATLLQNTAPKKQSMIYANRLQPYLKK